MQCEISHMPLRSFGDVSVYINREKFKGPHHLESKLLPLMALWLSSSWMLLTYCSIRSDLYSGAGEGVSSMWCTYSMHPTLKAEDAHDPSDYRGFTVVIIPAKAERNGARRPCISLG